MTEFQELEREVRALKVKQGQMHRDIQELLREVNMIRHILKKQSDNK